jgi:hypothetical protein
MNEGATPTWHDQTLRNPTVGDQLASAKESPYDYRSLPG